jgi:hypothetical protein
MRKRKCRKCGKPFEPEEPSHNHCDVCLPPLWDLPPDPVWVDGEERDFALDPNSTKNEGRFRLYPPKKLTRYFRTESKTPGVSHIMGRPKDGGKPIVQGLRFNKRIMSEDRARKWWDANWKKYEFHKVVR